MIIACDIDGCINDLVDKTLEMYNAEAGKNIKISDITTYKSRRYTYKWNNGKVELTK